MTLRTVLASAVLILLMLLAFLPAGGLSDGPCGMCIQRTGSPQTGEVPEGLTWQEWSGIRAAIERDRYRLRPCELEGQEVYQASNDAHNLQTTFTVAGVEVSPRAGGGEWRWGLRLVGYGYGELCEAISPAQLVVLENRIEYRRGELVEWYVNERSGLEQGFTLNSRPGGSKGDAPLRLHLGVTGDLALQLDSDGHAIGWADGDGVVVLTYGGLYAVDAAGRNLPAEIVIGEGGIVLRVDEEDACYPVTIDPMIQRAKLTASDAGADDFFGTSVAISGDTVVVGARYYDSPSALDCGAAYVFEKPPGGWSNVTQNAKLTASDAGPDDNFGTSVAISGDTVVVGARYYDSPSANCGAAYVFGRPPGGWSDNTQDAKLTASDAGKGDHFGFSVAISADTVVVGARYYDSPSALNCGAAYVFEKPLGGWSGTLIDNAKLTASDAVDHDDFGFSVAISGDTVVVGAHERDCGDGVCCGAAYVFEKPLGGWSGDLSEDAKLTASDAGADDNFGISVAISEDTVVIGAPYANAGCGAAYVFEKPGGGWVTRPGVPSPMNETAKLTASDGAPWDGFGGSAAISGDTVVVGAREHDCAGRDRHGAAYLFSKPLGTWTDNDEDAKLIGSDVPAVGYFGTSVAINGDTVVVGAYYANAGCGAAYVFGLLQRYDNGDVNGDGAIDLLDVVLCQQIASGLVSGTAAQREAADVDDDGDVDADDVTILSEVVLGIRATLP